ncbi:hypothetical protein L21SP3_02112 [Sedimentisphaera cyanobacteriorum]|uniref:Uncharacterized protein n=1 Tax=Sedimentisphaera cyanobacteriorum TaxID=1940790 RepID=A0A1Q2HSP1_9BACT|nr:hypothetical protein [Sedimentisphaera cyanobacteriorum]AQQ10284.1 hypothetical protein L21SP3_02112 [Sedimentisphaera cyanobacteriorum]
MKIKVCVIAVLGLFASAFLSGCGVVSINSMVGAVSQVTDENIEGRWVSEGGDFQAEIKRSNEIDAKVDDSNLGAKFLKPDAKDYQLKIVQKEGETEAESKTGFFNLKLLKAEDMLFAELLAKTKELKLNDEDISVFYFNQLLPMYNTLLVKDIDSEKIELGFLEYQSLEKFLKEMKTPYTVKESSPQYIFLTGSSEELRDFYVKAAEKKDLWKSITLKKESLKTACYDPRAVAIAYANSEMFDNYLKGRRRQYEKADASGNTKAADAIDKKMTELQEKFHKMAFSGESADMILEKVSGKVDNILQESGTHKLVNKWNPSIDTSNMEDLTVQLSAIFNPSNKTLKMIEQGTKNPPIK